MGKLFENTMLIKTMHFIAIVVIAVYLIVEVYQSIQINYLVSKKLITPEIYKELSQNSSREVGEKVMLVLVYFFGRESGKHLQKAE